MTKIYSIITILILLTFKSNGQSQNGQIKGIVKDEKGLTLPDLSVTLKGKKIGTKTDEKGFFKLNNLASGEYTLEISGVNYQTFSQKVILKNAEIISLNLTLIEKITELAETQVKGYRALNGVGKLGEVEYDIILSGKKNEVLVLDSINANTALNTTRQILGKIPGFNVSETEGSGFPSNGIAFRGLNPVQSVEMNTRQNGYNIAADISGYPETYYVPAMEAIQRIEVIRGASSLQFGPQFGGIVNYVTRDGAKDKPLEISVQQTIGSFGLFNNYVSVGGTKGKFNYFAYTQYRRVEGWRPNSGLSQISGFAKVSYQANSRLKLGLEYSILRNKIQMPGGFTDEQFAKNSQDSYRSRNWLDSPWNILTATADYQISPKTLLTIKSAFMLSQRNLVWRNEDGGPVALDLIDSTTLKYINREVQRESFQNNTTEVRLLSNYSLGKMNNTVAMGLRYYYGKMHRQGGGTGTTGSDFDLTLLSKGYEYDLNFTTTNVAPFIENIFRISDNFSLTPGVRFEFLNSTAKGFTTDEDNLQKTDKSKNRYILLLGMGLQYKTSESNNIYANWSQAYRPLDYSTLTPFGVLSKIDPNMKDAKGYNADFGYRGTIKNFFNFDIGGFYLSYENRVGLISLKDANGNDYTYRTNVANSIHKGIEAYLDLSITKLLLPNSQVGHLSIFNSLAYVDAKYTTGEFKGKQVEYAPKTINRLGIIYSFKGFSTTFQISNTAQSFGDANNTIKSEDALVGIIPAYQVIDWSGTYKFKKYNFKAGVNNLADARYFTRRTDEYPGPGIIPSVARNFYLSVGVKF